MALRPVPPREQELDQKYGGEGAYRLHVFAELKRGGRGNVCRIAEEESLDDKTLYRWIKRWRVDEAEKLAKLAVQSETAAASA